MGLYLCVFRGEEELAGFDAGGYDDFERFRDEARALDPRRLFRRFGTLRVKITPTTAWSPREAARLARELEDLAAELRRLPPRPLPADGWQAELARELGISPASRYESYFDVDGRPLVEGLLELCRRAVAEKAPILFQ